MEAGAVLITGCLLLLLFLFLHRAASGQSRGRLPPGPAPLPLLGNLTQNILPLYRSYRRLCQEYGPVFTVWLGPRPTVVLCGYEVVRDALVGHSEEFTGRAPIPVHMRLNDGYGLINSNGERWRQLRRFTLTTLHNLGLGKRPLEQRVQEEARHLAQAVADNQAGPPDGPMERLLLCTLALCLSPSRAQPCPPRCTCQTLPPSPAILCARAGLLFVPGLLDRRTAELRLTDNFIAAVRRRDFANMTRLVHLTLSRNALRQLVPFAFADLRGLRALHLDGNRLPAIGAQQLRGLPNLRHLILGNNQLQAVAPGAFDDFAGTLEDLDLSYNNLARLPWETIRRLSNVNSLSLDHNLIAHVPRGVFADLRKLARLDMTSNRLTTIPPDPLFLRRPVYARSKGSPLSSLVLAFGGNPFHCNCELLWLRRLAREDDLETCASPPRLLGRSFWSLPEEELACRPPVITRHTGRLAVREGQAASLLCVGAGDPEPAVRWLSPRGTPVANGSRTLAHADGRLEILAAAPQDAGAFTCVASNAAGEATASVALRVSPLPRLAAGTRPPAPGPSESLASAEAGADRSAAAPPRDGGVLAAELSASSALIRWGPPRPGPGVRMYQLQYNSSADEPLVYRMIPPPSRAFLVKDLAAGRAYDLCVVAVYDHGPTALTATRRLGCVRFSTRPGSPPCRALHTHFLGGTMIIIIGGIIVASVLLFIILLVIRYKAHEGSEKARVSHVYSQTNGGQPPASRAQEGANPRARDPNGLAPNKDGEKGLPTRGQEEGAGETPSPRRRKRSRTSLGLQSKCPAPGRAEEPAPLAAAPPAGERRRAGEWTDVKI